MTHFTRSTRFIVAFALLVPFAASLWIAAVPETMSASTFAVFAALITATASITLNTINSGRAAGSVGQLLQQAEAAPVPAARPIARRRSRA